jgi:hypothetical protein
MYSNQIIGECLLFFNISRWNVMYLIKKNKKKLEWETQAEKGKRDLFY